MSDDEAKENPEEVNDTPPEPVKKGPVGNMKPEETPLRQNHEDRKSLGRFAHKAKVLKENRRHYKP